jgi:hypothetical protein
LAITSPSNHSVMLSSNQYRVAFVFVFIAERIPDLGSYPAHP